MVRSVWPPSVVFSPSGESWKTPLHAGVGRISVIVGRMNDHPGNYLPVDIRETWVELHHRMTDPSLIQYVAQYVDEAIPEASVRGAASVSQFIRERRTETSLTRIIYVAQT